MNNTQKKSNPDELIYAEFEDGNNNFITREELKAISSPLKWREAGGTLAIIKKIKSLSEQKWELSDLAFEIKTNGEILLELTERLFKYDDNSEDYYKLIENISLFIGSNIIGIAEDKLRDLNSVLEATDHKKYLERTSKNNNLSEGK